MEPLLAEITSEGWFTSLREVNSTDGRAWWASLYHPGALRKSGSGPTALAALTAAWASDTIGEPLEKYPPIERPTISSILARVVQPQQIKRRF